MVMTKEKAFRELSTESDGVYILLHIKMIQEDKRLAFHYKSYGAIAETEHYELRIAGEMLLDEAKGKGYSSFMCKTDSDVKKFMEIFTALPYYVIVEKELSGLLHVAEKQFMDEAIEELKEYEFKFISEERLQRFLNADKGIRI